MQLPNIKVLVISIASPMLIGIYKDDILIETLTKEGKTSDLLPTLFEKILKKYSVTDIIYVNGPGSYMAIKIAYIFLKTVSIVNKINLFAISGFELNNNSPIKALGKKYFIRDISAENEIRIDFLTDQNIEEFTLPNDISSMKYSKNILPEYNLPAV